MGIKHLWNILTPYCERKPLYELQQKTVAVDLSCWICEAQNIAEYQVQPKMYLRNLYFRTSYLLLMEVYPVFVLEGTAPELKYDTIAARNAIQFKGAKPKKDDGSVKTGKGRSRFNFVLKQCQEMLGLMGLVCLTGKGEAESFCAYLNQKGFVDGIISQDSDCFAYGAQIVYRNFSISSQGSHAASGGAVDVYDIRKAIQNKDFGRNKIVALALLCGSDYCEGVQGVGKDSSLKLFEKYSDAEILERIRNWRKNESLYKEFENKLANKNICTSCGHDGKIQAHTKSGCKTCGTKTGCDFSKYKEERLCIKNEVAIRSKALDDPKFPNEELIDEYLSCKDHVTTVDLKWRAPNLVHFVKFTAKYLTWEEVYAFEKFLPILTRWQLINYLDLSSCKGVVYPETIVKKRAPKGIPSFEIIWSDRNGYFNGLIPDNQLSEIKDLKKFWSTIEPQSLVALAHPDLVEDFTKSKTKPKRKKKTVDKLNESFKNMSLTEPKPKRQRKKKATETSGKSIKLDDYLKTAIVNNFKKNEISTSTPVKKTTPALDLESSLDYGDDDSDLSDIIDDILAEPIPECFTEKLEELGFEIYKNDACVSSFFPDSLQKNDLFEDSFQEKYQSSSDEDDIDEIVAKYLQ